MAGPEPHHFSHQLLASLPTSGFVSAFPRARRDSFPTPSPWRLAHAARNLLPRSRGHVPRPRVCSSASAIAGPKPPLRCFATLSGFPMPSQRRFTPPLCMVFLFESFFYEQANWVLQRTWGSLRSPHAAEHCYVGQTSATCNLRREIFWVASARTYSFARTSPPRSSTPPSPEPCGLLALAPRRSSSFSLRTMPCANLEPLRSRDSKPDPAPDTFLGGNAVP